MKTFTFKQGDLVKFITTDCSNTVDHPIGIHESATYKKTISADDLYRPTPADVGLLTGQKLAKEHLVMHEVYINEGLFWFYEDNLIPFNL